MKCQVYLTWKKMLISISAFPYSVQMIDAGRKQIMTSGSLDETILIHLWELTGPSILAPHISSATHVIWLSHVLVLSGEWVSLYPQGSEEKSHGEQNSLQDSQAWVWEEAPGLREQEVGKGSSTSPVLQVGRAHDLEGGWMSPLLPSLKESLLLPRFRKHTTCTIFFFGVKYTKHNVTDRKTLRNKKEENLSHFQAASWRLFTRERRGKFPPSEPVGGKSQSLPRNFKSEQAAFQQEPIFAMSWLPRDVFVLVFNPTLTARAALSTSACSFRPSNPASKGSSRPGPGLWRFSWKSQADGKVQLSLCCLLESV